MPLRMRACRAADRAPTRHPLLHERRVGHAREKRSFDRHRRGRSHRARGSCVPRSCVSRLRFTGRRASARPDCQRIHLDDRSARWNRSVCGRDTAVRDVARRNQAIARRVSNAITRRDLYAASGPAHHRHAIRDDDERALVRLPAPPEARARFLILGDLSAIARTVSPHVQQRVLTVAGQFRTAQTWGDCLGYANLLEGKAHARIEAGLGVDDIAPIEPIILGAGGAVSTLDGTSLSDALSAMRDVTDRTASFSLVCASTDAMQRELVAALSATDERG